MARHAANGAVVSDDGQWYYSGFRWKPLVPAPQSQAPGFRSPEHRQMLNDGLTHKSPAGKAWRQGQSVGRAGEQLAALVAQHGGLEAAERALVEAQRPANYGVRSEDGYWWWDGQQWRPVGPG